MKKSISLLAIVGFLFGMFGFTSGASAAVTGHLYVATTGSDSNPGTKASPFKTISKAGTVATPGTVVHVAKGTYAENIHTTASGNATDRIMYISDTKWGAKIVPPSPSGDTLWWNEGAYTDIIGFEFDGSSAPKKIYMGVNFYGSHSTVQFNHVHHIATGVACSSGGGAGINGNSYNAGVDFRINYNVVDHVGPSGCSYIHGIYNSSSGEIKNNLVYQINGTALHLWHDDNHVDVANNTVFSSKRAIVFGSAAGEFYYTTGPADYINISNNIFYDNVMGVEHTGDIGTHITYTNNLVYGNTTNWNITGTHTGTVTADPLFVNYVAAGGGDYHLKAGSPAIDAGSPTYASGFDLDLRSRPQGGNYDIGAYEAFWWNDEGDYLNY